MDKQVIVNNTKRGAPWLLLMTFVAGILKLAGPLAAVSWWWITAPLWFVPAILLVFAIIAGLVVGVIFLFAAVADHLAREKSAKGLSRA
jgi:hypothetical protein